jgi:hypothetical protein
MSLPAGESAGPASRQTFWWGSLDYVCTVPRPSQVVRSIFFLPLQRLQVEFGRKGAAQYDPRPLHFRHKSVLSPSQVGEAILAIARRPCFAPRPTFNVAPNTPRSKGAINHNLPGEHELHDSLKVF